MRSWLLGTNGISTALTFACFYLASFPMIQDRLRQELLATFSEADGFSYMDPKTLVELPYLNAVVEESLRLGAPLGSFPRITPKGGATLTGVSIPEGTIVGVPVWAQMVSEDNFYPDPTSFRPERWLPGGLGPGSRLNKIALMTFSHGPYGCLGKTLAYHEMRLVIAKIILHCTLKLPEDFDSSLFLEGVRNLRVSSFMYPLRLQLT
ncbi:cytochrome P450 [Stereum hirsutum FP-91666 SS1]|uniref:cytochrome P450 n=1 Tax=Stereum hirsutum (strain FP-91666) TaxID=721885 RepID=UPI000440C038|nr:cytochrome P450 [Stereum hirsutum FP-91666 SS1]EIM91537.1 cytochrome P450 [Stereum hirsutum FP-91666 SS1]